MKWTNFFAVIALGAVVLLTSCGDLKKNDVVAQELENSQLKLECELDINAFKSILEIPITGAISCLDSTLNMFMRVVPSEHPDTLSLEALKRFLARYRNDITPDQLKMISAVFDLSRLFFGGEPGFIGRADKDKIINLAYVFNREASKHFELFKSTTRVSYIHHKDIDLSRVLNSVNIITFELKKAFNSNRNGEIHRLDIMKLLQSFTTSNSDLAKAEKMLFVKRLLLGGYKEEITHEELFRLFHALPTVVKVIFEGMRYQYLDIGQKDVFSLLSGNITSLRESIFVPKIDSRDEETLFETQELIDGLSALLKPEDFKPEAYRPVIEEAKTLIMGGGAELVKGKDLRKFFERATEIISRGLAYHRMYEGYADTQNSNGDRTLLSQDKVEIPASKIALKFPSIPIEYVKDFSRIVSSYRFLRGSFDSPYYSNIYVRNAAGFGEIGMLEYVIKLAAEKYGVKTEGALGGYSFDLDTLTTLMKKFQDFLEEVDLVLPGRAAKTAETITLMGSLFQFQSDRNGMLDVNELTEFAVSLIGGGKVGEKIHDDIAKTCKRDVYNRLDFTCYKANFYKALCRTSPAYFKRLTDWANINVNNCESIKVTDLADQYLARSIQAARTCNNYTDENKEDIPFAKSDATTILTAMMNIESTMSRYDVNKNNIMDKDEVQTSFDTYEPAIEGIVNKMSGIARTVAMRLKREIFMYLIKFEKAPETMELLKFVSIDFKKRQPATRKTIASILVTIGQQSSEPDPFDCKWMRNPNNFPRTQEERDHWQAPEEVAEDLKWKKPGDLWDWEKEAIAKAKEEAEAKKVQATTK